MATDIGSRTKDIQHTRFRFDFVQISQEVKYDYVDVEQQINHSQVGNIQNTLLRKCL